MYFIITVVISLVLYSNAVEGSIKCCGPKQWMSGVAQVVGAYNIDQDYYGLAEVASTFYYDYQHKKVAALQTVTNETAEPVTRQIKQILDYNMVRIFKTTYFLNDKSKHIDIDIYTIYVHCQSIYNLFVRALETGKTHEHLEYIVFNAKRSKTTAKLSDKSRKKNFLSFSIVSFMTPVFLLLPFLPQLYFTRIRQLQDKVKTLTKYYI
jgi:hypothetical protein